MISGSQRHLPRIIGLSVFTLLACLTGLAQRPRTPATAPARPPAEDFKITEKTTQAGQGFHNTTLIKGARQRSEMHTGYGPDTVSIVQCDLKRTIQINEKTRRYLVTPMSGGDATGAAGTAEPVGPASATVGGVVTYITNTIDTGERKEMFGFNARHLKSTMMIEPSPDACMKDKMHMERDGWYIDLQYGLNCGIEGPPQMGRPAPRGGCRDQFRFKRSGTANLGYPLIETTTFYDADGRQTMTTSKEVIELSRQPLDAALFEVPAGYTEAKSMQEMYGAPSMADIMAMANGRRQQSEGDNEEAAAGTATTARGRRVGVVAINNKTDHSVSTDTLRERLIGELNGNDVEAIPLNSTSPAEAEAEAKAKRCDFILYTDISALKAASAGKKLGGMLGRATGVASGDMGKSDSRIDFKLFPIGSTSATLVASANGKEEGDEASVGAALDREAQAVTSAVRKQ